MKERKIWLSLVTPFDENRNIDWSAAIEYIKSLDRYDFAGFLVAGSVGEGLLLSHAEIAEYIKLIRNISNKPIMVGVIDFNFARSCEKLTLDADFALVTPCIYFKPSQEATKEYFKLVALESAKNDKKVYLYNNASRVGINIDRSIYEYAYQFENIVGVKECDDNKFEEHASEFARWDFLTGNDAFMITKDFVNGKGVGCISTLANIAPDLALKLAANPFDENASIAWENLCAHAYSIPNPIAVKQMLAKWGIMKPYFRAQMHPLPEFDYPIAQFDGC